jgi:predicted ArsR family transcriptional regulator
MNRVHWLRNQEIQQLQELHHHTQMPYLRARCEIILLSDQGLTPPQIAKQVGSSRRTVTRCIQSYEAQGIAGLYHRPKPGRPRKLPDAYPEHS